MTPDIDEWTGAVRQGDALAVLDELPANSVHAVVTDPPYGLAFMGRDWDDFESKEYQAWCEEWTAKAKRVLRPGGHLLAFSGNRTHHRLFSGVEDAGLEVRDTVTWHYGSGFPKALDVSKALDKRADAVREVVGEKTAPDGVPLSDRVAHSGEEYDETSADYDDCKRDVYEPAPATDAAARWDGWRTTLKPASEFVVVARVPLDGTVAETVQEWGTGALNIDGCRIGTDGGHEHPGDEDSSTTVNALGDGLNGTQSEPVDKGRYPSNVVFGERAAAALDREVGELGQGVHVNPSDPDDENHSYGDSRSAGPAGGFDDGGGGPSRYFYTSKASRAERTLDGKIDNTHPTVKPADLMEWLVKLVTREGQVVLDPFAGSGTTLKAAKDLGREFVGIEQNPEWCDVARVRTGLTPEDPATVRGDDGQAGLETFGTGGDD